MLVYDGCMFENTRTLWFVRMSIDSDVAKRALAEGFICIGYADLGDASRFTTRDEMRAAVAQTWQEWSPKSVSSRYGQIFRFVHEMKIGDPVIFPIPGTREIAIGKITGDYRWEQEDTQLVEKGLTNLRSVEWLKTVPRIAFSQTALHSFGTLLTISTNDNLDEVNTVLDQPPTEEQERDEVEVTPAADEDTDVDQYETARQETEDYLLKAWLNTAQQFEHVVAAVLRAIGYTAQVTPGSGDHGVDVIAHPDVLGVKKPYIKVQVKSGSGTTNEATIRELKGGLGDGEQGIVIALGGFTVGAKNFVRNDPNLTLFDGPQFVHLFLDHYNALAPEWRAKYPLKQVFVPSRNLSAG